MIAFVLFSKVFALITKINDTNIIVYKIVHAGANTHAGGVKDGLFKVSYQIKSIPEIIYHSNVNKIGQVGRM